MATDSVRRSAIVPYSAQEMYVLVADIPAYPEFLPWCSHASIDSEQDDSVVATVGIAFKGLRKSFTTRNRQLTNERIELSLVDGPFSELDGVWQFKPLGEEGSEISLSLDFGFSSRLVATVVGPVFGHIANTMVDAFLQRAESVYGQRSS